MSRIHEALKKAEQERAAGQGRVQPTLASEPVSEVPVLPELASPRMPESTMAAAMPKPEPPGDVEVLDGAGKVISRTRRVRK